MAQYPGSEHERRFTPDRLTADVQAIFGEPFPVDEVVIWPIDIAVVSIGVVYQMWLVKSPRTSCAASGMAVINAGAAPAFAQQLMAVSSASTGRCVVAAISLHVARGRSPACWM